MSVRYLYVDDDVAFAAPLAELVAGAGAGLEIETRAPLPFDQQSEQWGDQMPDGIILDLRLDMVSTSSGPLAYRGPTLAQELRTRMTEGKMKSLPLVLWSADARMNESFDADSTGHDLFDLACTKTVLKNSSETVHGQLVSLAAGYKTLVQIFGTKSSSKRAAAILGIDEERLSMLDPRIAANLVGRGGPVHDAARVLLRQLLEVPGPLISESIMLARLGVKRESTGFANLAESVSARAGFTGVFSSAWPRFWSGELLAWWSDRVDAQNSPRRLSASERIEALTKAGFNGLEAAVSADKRSDKFWTVCALSGAPLDPIDGIILDVPQAAAWSDATYVFEGDANGAELQVRGLRIHPLEMPRLRALKE